jgi:ABC-type transport system involved in multi-copper enzyme maturation permease subunit
MIHAVRTIAIVFAFEFRRAIGLGRLALCAGLVGIPVSLLLLIQYHGAHLEVDRRWALLLFALIPGVSCLLGLLAWVTPLLQAEVDDKTWTYLAVRPAGRTAILFGKYAAAVVWVLATALVALAACLPIVVPASETFLAVRTMLPLVLMSTVTYGAIYLFLGTMFLRRGMVAAVAYTFFVEFIGAMVPATIHELTVRYHLCSLLFGWVDGPLTPRRMESLFLFGHGPAWQYIAILAGIAIVMLSLTSVVLHRREWVAAQSE